jgi:hypothetical protein
MVFALTRFDQQKATERTTSQQGEAYDRSTGFPSPTGEKVPL